MVARYLRMIIAGAALWSAPLAALENRLANHPSPYLALHAADPVAWQAWDRATADLARERGKPLFISVGYFACHWCHVMQRESYRDEKIARFLNEHFMPVKVDRELDPALDARLIEFAESTRGAAGWPLNVFLTPDGNPFYAALYLPPGEFLAVLERVAGLWQNERARVQQLARQEGAQPQGPGKPQLDAARVRAYQRQFLTEALRLADPMQGGFGEQNKFPMVPQLEWLLERQARAPDRKLGEFLLLTLDRMADGGLRDHLGGGFFRYTVDPGWREPHFEKMLYDNALLARLYLRAAAVFGRKDYRAVALETLDFMTRSLRAPEGGFIASLSAVDAQGVEGGYYLFGDADLEGLLSAEELAAVRSGFSMQGPAPFDAGHLPQSARPPKDAEAVFARARDKLRAARATRALPRDAKRLAAWNGLALSAFATAARAGGSDGYRQVAQELRDFLATTLWDGRQLRRALAGDRAIGAVSVEDYAHVASGLLEWAELTGVEADFVLVREIVRQAWARFYGPAGWRLEEQSLIVAESGQDALADGPIPSPSGVLARVSLRLAERLKDKPLRVQALAALNSGHRLIESGIFWYPTQIGAMPAAG